MQPSPIAKAFNPYTKPQARHPGSLLKGYANGGAIEGPGTATSDSIPAKVKQTGEPIQVANGERIVSADQDALLLRIAKAMGHKSVDEMFQAGTGKPVGPTVKYSKGGKAVKAAEGGAVIGNTLEPYVNHRFYQPPPVVPGTAVGPANYQPNFTMGASQAAPVPESPVTDVRAKYNPANGSPEAKAWQASRQPVTPPAPTATAEVGPANSTGQRAANVAKNAGLSESGAGRGALLAGISYGSSTDSIGRPTEDYRRRLGMDPNGTNPVGDLAARSAGVVSDFGARILDTPVDTLNAGLKMLGGKGDVSLPGGSFADYLQQNDNPARQKQVAAQQIPAADTLSVTASAPFDYRKRQTQLPEEAAAIATAPPVSPILGNTEGVSVGNGITRFNTPGKSPLFTNMTDAAGMADNAALTNRFPMTAQNQGAMDGIQSRQDARMSAMVSKAQYDKEVAGAQAVNDAGERLNLEYSLRNGNPQERASAMALLTAANATAKDIRGNAVVTRGQDITANASNQTNKLAQNKDTREGAAFEAQQKSLIQLAALHTELGKETNPAKRYNLLERILALQGKEKPAQFKTTALQAVKNADGSTSPGMVVTTNEQTGEAKVIDPSARPEGSPTPRAEYDKLPKGATYIGTDGQHYTKG